MPTSQAVWWEPRGADPENKFCEFNYSAQMWSRLLCIQGNWARLPGGGSRQMGQTDQTSWDALQRGCLNLKNWGNKMSCSWPELYRIYSSAPPAPVYSGYISSVLVTTLPFVLPMRAFVTLLAHWSSGNLKKKKVSTHPRWLEQSLTLSLCTSGPFGGALHQAFFEFCCDSWKCQGDCSRLVWQSSSSVTHKELRTERYCWKKGGLSLKSLRDELPSLLPGSVHIGSSGFPRDMVLRVGKNWELHPGEREKGTRMGKGEGEPGRGLRIPAPRCWLVLSSWEVCLGEML